MMWFVAFGAVALASGIVICAAALVEVFSQLAELRSVLDTKDEPIPLGLKASERRTAEIGLPARLTFEPKAIVIFLSTKCATCLAIAEAFRGGSPSTVWFVLAGSPEPVTLLATLAGSGERVIVDEDDAIAGALGLNVTPAVITTSYGEIIRAQAVSTPRQAMALIPTVFPLDEGQHPAHLDFGAKARG